MEDETSPLDFKTELNQFQHNKKFQKNQCRQPYFQWDSIYGKAAKDCKLVVIRCGDPYLWVVSNNMNSKYDKYID